MNRTLSLLCVVAVAAVIASMAIAQDDAPERNKKNRKKGPQQPPQISQLQRRIDGLGLSEEQSTKVKAILESYTPKFRELNEKQDKILTDEQRRARREGAAKAREEGKRGRELNAAVSAALNLTDEQKKAQEEVQTSLRELNGKMLEEIRAQLNDEQKEKLRPMRRERRPQT